MTREPRSDSTKPKPITKEDRLKAALKANMARRKAQARARSGQDDETPGDETGADNDGR